MFCKGCNKDVLPRESIQKFDDGSFHVRGDCVECNGFSTWLSWDESTLVKRLVREEFRATNKQ